ncbi:MAG: PilZ domain-containing protein [Magnetococcales bacterium]|nr:PilZ domain-containing protein [Magnetococcales bacterium]
MDLHPIKTDEDLANELFQLAERAKMGGLEGDNIESLDSIIENINNNSETIEPKDLVTKDSQKITGSAELRNSYRMNVNRDAIAIFKELRMDMKITDVSTTGFGLFSDEKPPEAQNIHLEINGIDGMDIYSCKVCSCNPSEGGYQLGLLIIKKLPRL